MALCFECTKAIFFGISDTHIDHICIVRRFLLCMLFHGHLECCSPIFFRGDTNPWGLRDISVFQKTQTFWLHTSHEPRSIKVSVEGGCRLVQVDVWVMMTTDVFYPCFYLIPSCFIHGWMPYKFFHFNASSTTKQKQQHSNPWYPMTLKCWRLESKKNTSPVRHVNHKFPVTFLGVSCCITISWSIARACSGLVLWWTSRSARVNLKEIEARRLKKGVWYIHTLDTVDVITEGLHYLESSISFYLSTGVCPFLYPSIFSSIHQFIYFAGCNDNVTIWICSHGNAWGWFKSVFYHLYSFVGEGLDVFGVGDVQLPEPQNKTIPCQLRAYML